MDAKEIKNRLVGQWATVISQLCRIDPSILDGEHHPCPKCGGKKRFNLCRKGTGAAYCNDCPDGKDGCVAGSGIDTIMWLNGWDFPSTMRELEAYVLPKQLPIPESERKFRHRIYTKLASIFGISERHISDLRSRGLSDTEIEHRGYWSITSPLTTKLFEEFKDGRKEIGEKVPGVFSGGSLKIHAANSLMVPVRDIDGNVIGIQYRPNEIKQGGAKYLWLSSNSHGVAATSTCHFALPPVNKECKPKIVRITEGPLKADIATAYSGIRTLAIAGTGSWKVGVDGTRSILPEIVYLAFDMDEFSNPGVARAVVDTYDALIESGTLVQMETWDDKHKGIDDAFYAGSVVNILDIEETKKQIDRLRLVKKGSGAILESDDDPHRLAKINVSKYESEHGGKLIFWRDEWWRYRDGVYRRIAKNDLRAKINAMIRTEFIIQWQEKRRTGGDDKPVQKVTPAVVTGTIEAMQSMCRISWNIDMQTWLPTREQRHLITMENGILDIDAVFRGRDPSEFVIEHSPDWFSTIKLGYAFDENADCPLWEEYLARTFDNDSERIQLVQEWAGYLFTHGNSEQKFLSLEGEGGNGKTVFMAAMTAMIGRQNISSVPLEKFGGRFDLYNTIGKMVNICGDVGEIDRVAEGQLKDFTGGGSLLFDRKGIEPVEAIPSAKLMMSWNTRPRFRDRSHGLWRRLLLVPFNRRVPEEEKISGMTDPDWWIRQGEVAGILLWAIAGLHRLKRNGKFTMPKVSREAIDDYVLDSNPALDFITSEIEEESSAYIQIDWLYRTYVHWAEKSGHRPLGIRQFGKEIRKHIPKIERERLSFDGRPWIYKGIKFSNEEIFSMSTDRKKNNY